MSTYLFIQKLFFGISAYGHNLESWILQCKAESYEFRANYIKPSRGWSPLLEELALGVCVSEESPFYFYATPAWNLTIAIHTDT